MPFNRCGKFLSNIVNGGNNSDELGQRPPRTNGAAIGASIAAIALTAITAAGYAFA